MWYVSFGLYTWAYILSYNPDAASDIQELSGGLGAPGSQREHSEKIQLFVHSLCQHVVVHHHCSLQIHVLPLNLIESFCYNSQF